MAKKTTTVRDGRYPSEKMRELGKRGAAAVARDPVTNRFVKRAADPTPPAPPDPPVESTPSLLARFFGRDR